MDESRTVADMDGFGTRIVAPVERLQDFRKISEHVNPLNPKKASCSSAEGWVKIIDHTGDSYNLSAVLRLHCAWLSFSS